MTNITETGTAAEDASHDAAAAEPKLCWLDVHSLSPHQDNQRTTRATCLS